MRKCEKDFDRKVFSFLYILLDALPLSLISVSSRPSFLRSLTYTKIVGCGTPYCSQKLKSFKQGWVKRVARINPSATK